MQEGEEAGRSKPRLKPQVESDDELWDNFRCQDEELVEELKPEEIDIKDDSSDNLVVDENSTENDTSSEKEISRADQIFECAECGYTTTSKPTLKSHVKIHLKKKPFVCTLCNYRTADKSNLSAHLRMHAGIKRHKCTICDYKTSTKFSLREHMNGHTGEKPYRCNVCEFRTATRSSLKGHLDMHMGEKRFKCSQCDFRGISKLSVRRHALRHSDEKPYPCAQCSYKAKDSRRLKRHIRNMHSEKVNKKSTDTSSTATHIRKDTSVESISYYPVDGVALINDNTKLPLINNRNVFLSKRLGLVVSPVNKNNCGCDICTT